MVEVTFYRDARQRLSRFFASGHVEIPESSPDEFSLVCAAVSAVLQAAAGGLEAYAHVPVRRRMEKGALDVRVPEAARADAATMAILATAELATDQIARQYPAHVRVTRRNETG